MPPRKEFPIVPPWVPVGRAEPHERGPPGTIALQQERVEQGSEGGQKQKTWRKTTEVQAQQPHSWLSIPMLGSVLNVNYP